MKSLSLTARENSLDREVDTNSDEIYTDFLECRIDPEEIKKLLSED